MFTSCCMIILAVFAGSVGLCSLIFIRFNPFRQYSVSPLPTTSLEQEDVINQFPGFFRDDIEEEVFEWEWYNAQANPPARKTPTFSKQGFDKKDCERNTIADDRCPTTSPFYGLFNIRQMPYCKPDVIHHKHYIHNGCCSSHTVFIPYESLPLAVPGLSGTVEVAQFVNYKQYFSIQECCQWPCCKIPCTCRQTNYVVTAVVKIKGKFCGELVRVPGSCQCINHC
ncbi:uncharacterized protein [Littorina saxatilis]|uniref:Uncharacterized protein n=1 Tax=Littorina saxatilis TaxID=31220 RepID=A0AAN9GF17_9CAEN